MKYIILMVLIFTSTYCLAIDQKLINGAGKYETAIENLENIESDIRSAQRSLEYWSKILDENKFASYGIRKFDKDHIDESNRQLHYLNIQHIKAKEIVEKYKPIKKKYDEQVEIERKWDDLKTAILNITGMLILPLSIFFLALWGMIRYHKKCKRLLKEGKITQEEYDRMTRSSHTFSDSGGVNPATGLPMTGIGISDVGGNVRGSSSSSALNASKNYVDSSRW